MFRWTRMGMLALLIASGSAVTTTAVAQESEEGGIAAIGSAFTYQGRLRVSGEIPTDANYAFQFRLFSVATGGAAIAGPINQTLFVRDGLFTTLLDFGTPPFIGDRRWLEITVGGVVLAPRVELTPAPYALFAAGPWVTSGTTLCYTSGDVGVGTCSPEAPLHVQEGSAGSITAHGNSILALERSASAYINLLVPAASESGILFGDPTGGATDGGIIYSTTNQLQLRTNGNSTRMVVGDTGNVGIGNTSPQNKLHVTGNADALALEGTDHVYMEFYPDGYAAGRKGWAGYGSASSDHLYIRNEATDANLNLDVAGAGLINVGAGVSVNDEGDISLSNDLASITFAAAAGANSAMVNMFATGASNADRMVIAHSPAFQTYGLQYQDNGDKFNFLSAGSNAMTVDLGNRFVGIRNSSPAFPLDLVGRGLLRAGFDGTAGLWLRNTADTANVAFIGRTSDATATTGIWDGNSWALEVADTTGNVSMENRVSVGEILQVGTTATTHRATIQHTDNNTLRLIGAGSFGSNNTLNFGDADYAFIREDSDDNLTIHAVGGNGGRLRVEADTIQWAATKPATVKLDNGTEVKLYAEEATEVFFTDYGSAQLSGGAVRITLEPEFLQTVTIDDAHPIKVFVQLEGECNGVFVTNKTATSFDVRELQGGRSNAEFSYRVVAYR
ncbi:MAG: hypothetical protein JNG88_17985, partial [Phycisphaerales bacterium]|nr:hypothetical protein [Phycisphaerales bacterium]